MHLPNNSLQYQNAEETDVYSFQREAGQWHIHLPAYLACGWTKNDLRMTEGAHKFLSYLAGGAQKLRLRLRTLPEEGMDSLQLVELCEAPRGGAIYLYRKNKLQTGSDLFWICDLALFVFGDMPERIYVQRLPGKSKMRTGANGADALQRDERSFDFSPGDLASLHPQKR